MNLKCNCYLKAIILFSINTLFGCEFQKGTEQATLKIENQSSLTLPTIEVQTIQLATFETKLPIVGQVVIPTFKMSNTINAGHVQKIYVKNNQFVKKGDLIIEVVDNAINLELLRIQEEYHAKRKLYKIELGQRDNKSDSTQLKLFYGLNYLEGSLHELLQKKQKLNWVAPFNGIISIEKLITEQSEVSSINDFIKIYSIMDSYIEAVVPLIYLNELKVGQAVVNTTNVDSFKIIEINLIDTKDDFFKIKIDFDKSLLLKNNQRLLLSIITNTFENVPQIPIKSLLKRNNEFLAFVIFREDSLTRWIKLPDLLVNEKYAYSPKLAEFTNQFIAVSNHANLTHFQKVIPIHYEDEYDEFDF